MTNNNDSDAQATCTFCGGDYPQERADIGYNYCMEAACTKKGFKAKQTEIEWTQADTARF